MRAFSQSDIAGYVLADMAALLVGRFRHDISIYMRRWYIAGIIVGFLCGLGSATFAGAAQGLQFGY